MNALDVKTLFVASESDTILQRVVTVGKLTGFADVSDNPTPNPFFRARAGKGTKINKSCISYHMQWSETDWTQSVGSFRQNLFF